MTKVLSSESDADDVLESYIESIEKDTQDTAAASEPRTVGHGPPCAKYQQLMTIAAWAKLLDELHECEDAAASKEFSTDFPRPKVAFIDLMKAANNCIKEMERLVTQEEAGVFG